MDLKFNYFNRHKDLDDQAALKPSERISYGAGGLGNAIVNAIVTGFLLFFYTDQLHINGGVVGTIFLIAKFLDAISDLIMGYLVDQTNTKYGKARPWILWAALPYAVSGIVLFFLQGTWPHVVQYVFIFVTYLATQSVLFTAVCTPYNALNALITKNQYERGVLGATNVVGNLLAQILVNTFMLRLVSFFGNNQAAWILATTVFAILGFTAHMLCFSNTYERSAGDPKEVSPKFSVSLRSLAHNRYWIIVTISQTLLSIMNTLQLSSAVYFATGVVHNSNAIAGLTNTMNIGQLVTILLSFIYLKKIGKGSSVRIGYSAVVITYIIQIFVGGNYTALMILGVLRGLGMGMGSACFGGILSDTVEYGEWKTHVRTVGMTNASNSFSQKVGGGLGTATVGWLIAAAGYQAGAAVQNAATITALNTLFTYIPLVCAAIVVILMGYYKLDKFYPQIISDLNDRHASSKQA